MEAKEQFTPNVSLNDNLHRLLCSFDAGSQRRIAAILRERCGAAERQGMYEIAAQIHHVFVELLFGERLLELGYAVEYEADVDEKKPDWLDRRNGLLVDCMSAGPMKEVFDEYGHHGCWAGFPDAKWGCNLNQSRIVDSLEDKVGKYREIVQRRGLKYVIAVFGPMENDSQLHDCRLAIEKWNFFNDRSYVSGVLYTLFWAGDPCFQYIANPHADYPVDLANPLTSENSTTGASLTRQRIEGYPYGR